MISKNIYIYIFSKFASSLGHKPSRIYPIHPSLVALILDDAGALFKKAAQSILEGWCLNAGFTSYFVGIVIKANHSV